MTAAETARDTHPTGGLEIFEGPCCDDLACPVRECWERPGETHAEFLVRLTLRYRGWVEVEG